MVNPLPYSDFRSDTATAPTPEMFAAMMKSSLGDDVYNEDDSVKKLERYVAMICGHEAALFCASGTMSNQLALRTHLNNPPQSAMVDIRSHVFNYEAGGISFHSQAAVYPVMPSNGRFLTAEDVAARLILDVDVHYAPTRVISLENTLNGTVMPLEEMARIRLLTREHGIKLHLDGARLWHACIHTGISMSDYCSQFDTISLCLSKGIGAPIGSILVGSELTIKKARHFRLLFGGGWRQAGILAEAALWGIKNIWPTMTETHKQAKYLEEVLVQIGCHITNPVETNMIWMDTSDAGFTVEELMAELSKKNIKISGSGTAARIVLHYQISQEAVERFVDVLRDMAATPNMKINVDIVRATEWSKRPQPTSGTRSVHSHSSRNSRVYEEDHLRSQQGKEESLESSIPFPTTPNTPEVGRNCMFQSMSPSSPSGSDVRSAEAAGVQATPPATKNTIYDEDEVLRRHSNDGVPNMKRCLFQESREPPKMDEDEDQFYPLQVVPVIPRSSRRSGGRPISAYEADRRARVDLEELLINNNSGLLGFNDPKQPAAARALDSDEDESARYPSSRMAGRLTKSLDLQELEARAATVAAVHAAALAAGTVTQEGDQQQPTALQLQQVPLDKKKMNKLPFKLAQNPASKAFKRASLRITRWGNLLTREG
ncbi:threonine aldolase [Entomortierella parvispora]|uniref:Threonine aldolase n=1 Tax=Entomortierella parvispora TaxID=205924 RepID=A0A9P3LTH0_9FUNG|nr:threonine aldolase [Entomortierella parvispora]